VYLAIRTLRAAYLGVVIVDETARDQVSPARKVYNGRLISRALAGRRGTSASLCNRFLNGGSIIGDSVTDSAIRLDIPEHCVIVWVRIEASNALVLYVL